MSTLTLAATDPAPRPRRDALAIPVDDGLLLCAADQLIRLNDAGAAVWDLLDGRRTVAEVAAELAAGFVSANGGPTSVDVESTRRFVHDLILAGVLEPPAPPT